MDYTDVFTSEDDALMRMRIYGHSRDYTCPSTSSRKIPTPKPILRSGDQHQNQRPMLHQLSRRGTSVLMQAVSAGDVESTRTILSAGSRSGSMERDQDGQTPLHVAAGNGMFEIIKLLLTAFPAHNVNIVDCTGSSALHRAAAIGSVEVIQALLERGAQVNIQDTAHGNTALHEAAWKGYSMSTELLCAVGRLPNLVNFALFTPLHLAVQGGHNQTARILIRSGADLAAQNRFGDTALHTAVRYGHAGVTRILVSCQQQMQLVAGVEAGFRAETANQNGDTALHIAAALKRRKIARILLQAGCSPHSPHNLQHESPLQVATKKNHSEIVAIFSELSSSPKTVVGFSSTQPQTPAEPVQWRKGSMPVNDSQLGAPPAEVLSRNNKVIKTSTKNKIALRAQSASPHDTTPTRTMTEQPNKTSTKKSTSIMKSLFSRKKKKEKEPTPVAPSIQPGPPHSLLPQPPQPSTATVPWTTPGFGASANAATMEPPRNNLFYSDLAGNIKRGPVGVRATCNCGHSHNHQQNLQQRRTTQPNICLDHGYVDYHGPIRSPTLDQADFRHPKQQQHQLWQDNSGGIQGGILVRTRSDESLNQSEHKLRMQQERLKRAMETSVVKPVVKGRRTVTIAEPQQQQPQTYRRPETHRPFESSGRVGRSSIPAVRPSPDGQTDSLGQNSDPKVDWRAARMRGERVFLPSSKV